MMNRADKGSFVNWWFTVDRVALALMLVLAGIGLMLAFAASPAVTGRSGSGDFHYAGRQMMYAAAALAILLPVPRGEKPMTLSVGGPMREVEKEKSRLLKALEEAIGPIRAAVGK